MNDFTYETGNGTVTIQVESRALEVRAQVHFRTGIHDVYVARQLGVDNRVAIHHSRDAREEGEDERCGVGSSYHGSSDNSCNSIPFHRFATLRNTTRYA